jgi:hypothetical protein
MKKVRYENDLIPLPEPGSSWVAWGDGLGNTGITLEQDAESVHQYWDNSILFPNQTICTVLESWHKDRIHSVAVIVLPKTLDRIVVRFTGRWEDSGWERI